VEQKLDEIIRLLGLIVDRQRRSWLFEIVTGLLIIFVAALITLHR
jgi:hypothetical protein